MLEEIKENEVPKVLENQEHREVSQTFVSLRISTRLSRFPEQFSTSLHYLLMTNSGEPEYYEEAM